MAYSKYARVWHLMKEIKFEFNLKAYYYLSCIKCSNILIKASFPSCGCRYCYDCLNKYDGLYCLGKKRECSEQMINIKNIEIDNYINDIISKLEVKCPKSDCEFRSKLKNIPEHLDECSNVNFKSELKDLSMNFKNNHINESQENINNEIRLMKKDIEELKNENKMLLNAINSVLKQEKWFIVNDKHFNKCGVKDEKHLPKELQFSNSDLKSSIFNSNNKFIWKIDKFLEKKKFAQYLFKTEIKSDEFFTDVTGYKMRLTVFPNGFGDGKDTHMSVVFCILKGPHDDCLKWPLKNEIKIDLINQESQSSYSCIKYQFSSTNENMKYIYHKPTSIENRGFGTSKFIKLDELIGNTFLCKNDTVILTCSVSRD